MIHVRTIEIRDAEEWLRMRVALWPEGAEAEHRSEIEMFYSGFCAEPLAVLIAEDHSGSALGIAELSIRSHAHGCVSERIGYLEGWYVVPEARRHGVGRALVRESEAWARAQGCTEFASDTEAGNSVSIAAHRALGFAEAGTPFRYRKDL